jgi:DNA-binding CsgD family transcriptional regulator
VARAEDDELRIVACTSDGRIILSDGSALTSRELEILRLLVSGARNREMAAELFLSVHTVEYHVTHILQKLRARSRTEATITAIRLGLHSLPCNARLESSLDSGEPAGQERRPIRFASWRLVAPLLLALSGLLTYIAVSGAPFDSQSAGPANASAQPSAQPSETTTDLVPLP